MTADLASVGIGLVVLLGASVAAWFLKRRMDEATGIEVVGLALTLMVANILQLVGIVVLLAGIFGDR